MLNTPTSRLQGEAAQAGRRRGWREGGGAGQAPLQAGEPPQLQATATHPPLELVAMKGSLVTTE